MSLSSEDMRRIGGSDVAAICGVSPYAGPLSVWLRVVHGAQQPDNGHTGRGRRLEPVVLDWYREETGHVEMLPIPRLHDPKRPHLRATFDMLASAGGALRPVEAKTANAGQAHHWGEEGTDQIPPWYLTQAQFYLGFGAEVGAVSDSVCDVPALVGGDFRLYRVTFDSELYGEMLERVERFWVNHVLTRRPPEDEPLPRDVDLLGRAFRPDGDKADFSQLAQEAQVTLEEYLRALQECRTAEQRRDLWQARAMLALGGASGVRRLPPEFGMSSISWGEQAGRVSWKDVAEALAKKHGLETQLSALIAENTGEPVRVWKPNPLRRKGP